MENKRTSNVTGSTCQCRCPCHSKSIIAKTPPNSNDVPNFLSPTHNYDNLPRFARPTTCPHKKAAQISFTESYQVSETEAEPLVSYNPFKINTPPPVGAAFSKSFLHVKNIVKNMTARWESLSEPIEDSTKRYSLTGRCMDDTTNCTKWKRESVELDDEKKYEWKYESKVPENIETHSYTLQPLQNTFNHDLYTYPDTQIQTCGLYDPEPDYNSFQQHPKYFDDNVPRITDITEEFENHTNDNFTNTEGNFHSTNPFKVTQTETVQHDALVPIGFYTSPQNTIKAEDSINRPDSIQYEIKNIGKSFEDEADEIVANVNRKSFDSSSPRPHSADNTAAIKHATRPQTTKCVANIENSERTKENEWKVNTGIPLSERSKGVSKINARDFPAAPAVHTVQTQIGTMDPSFTEKSKDDNARAVVGVQTSLSLDMENPKAFSLRRKSFEEQLMLSTGSQTATGSHHEESKRRHSAPSKISSLSQNQKNFLREDDDGGFYCVTGCKSNKSRENNKTSESAIQTSLGSPNEFGLDSSHRSDHCRKIEEKESHDSNSFKHRKPPIDRTGSQPHELNHVKPTVEHHNSDDIKAASEKTSRNRNKHVSPEVIPETELSADEEPNVNTMRKSAHEEKLDKKESTYLALISVPTTRNFFESGDFDEVEKPSMYGELIPNSVELYEEQNIGSYEVSVEDQAVLASLSKEYDEMVATPPNVCVEPIGHSVSVTNAATKLHVQNHHDRSSQRSSHSAPAKTITPTTMKRRTLSDKGRRENHSATIGMHRGKREFYICHKCHKIVESGEAAFYSDGGFEIAWHAHCFQCYACEKNLSQADHNFFDEEPYCLEHYARVANIPKCFKCEELIFDSTYTSAAGNSWHRHHFTCQACRRPLVDTKYVFAQNKHAYCFQCHERHFPKQCKTCQGRISPQEPYVQGGSTFWHSNNSCLHCSSCKGSLVGRSLFFRRDGRLYCNRYCALREM